MCTYIIHTHLYSLDRSYNGLYRNGNELIRELDVLGVVKGISDHILDKTTVGSAKTGVALKFYGLCTYAVSPLQLLHNFAYIPFLEISYRTLLRLQSLVMSIGEVVG